MIASINGVALASSVSDEATVGGGSPVRAICDIAVVIPAWNEERHIAAVIKSVPQFVRHVIVVEDCGSDRTVDVVQAVADVDDRVILIQHHQNQGVGGAMISGFREAIRRGARIVVKMDGDGQMSPEYLCELIQPLLDGQADYSKGNRFHDFEALRQMPLIRRFGNIGLGFLTRVATGYWTCFDPCNGYIAIRGEVLRRLALSRLHKSYFFETSMLAELYLHGAVVADVPMPAIYGDEVSHLSVTRVFFEFPPKLLKCFLRRLFFKNVLYDFSMLTVYLVIACLMLVVGSVYGGINWYLFSREGLTAPVGTVVIPAMLITLGTQLFLSAINEDIRATPRQPLTRRILGLHE